MALVSPNDILRARKKVLLSHPEKGFLESLSSSTCSQEVVNE